MLRSQQLGWLGRVELNVTACNPRKIQSCTISYIAGIRFGRGLDFLAVSDPQQRCPMLAMTLPQEIEASHFSSETPGESHGLDNWIRRTAPKVMQAREH